MENLSAIHTLIKHMVNSDECFYVVMPELVIHELNVKINNSLQGAFLNHLKEQKIKLEIHDVRSFLIKND